MTYATENQRSEAAEASTLPFGIKRSQVQILSPRIDELQRTYGSSEAVNGADSAIVGRQGGRQSGPRTKLKGESRVYCVDPLTGCHVWLRSLDQDGYGYFNRKRKRVRAHRYY